MQSAPACRPEIEHSVYGKYHFQQVSPDFIASTDGNSPVIASPDLAVDPLFHAITHNNLDDLSILLKTTPGFSPNSNLLDLDYTPLHLASSRGFDLLVVLLLYHHSLSLINFQRGRCIARHQG
jgi:ankyrin repeat protein